MSFEILTLTKDSPDLEKLLPKIRHLSRQVFEPEIPESQYDAIPSTAPQLQLSEWRTRLAWPHAAIFYATRTTDNTDDEGSEVDKPVAFFLAHPRVLVDGAESYYIYLAAVHPSARGQGIFPFLLDASKAWARRAGCQILSVGTIPSRFGRMYTILSREGSGWEVVEWKDGEDGVQKVVLKMTL